MCEKQAVSNPWLFALFSIYGISHGLHFKCKIVNFCDIQVPEINQLHGKCFYNYYMPLHLELPTG